MNYILAHDLGTSGNKATLFREDGTLVGSVTKAYPLYQDSALTAEQDAEDWWRGFRDSTKELLMNSGTSPEDVAAVSFSGQMMGCLPVDRNGRPLRRALIWADQRAQEEAALLSEKIPLPEFYQIVGHRNTASYAIQKAMWLRTHEPEIYENTYKFLNAKDFIVSRLTGKFCTDPSDANSTTCFDIHKLQWSERILSASGIDPEKLPEIVPSTAFVGNVTEEAAKETGLSTKTRVIMGAGDGVAANVGAGSVAPGSAYLSLGTSAWVASTSEEPILDPEMRIVCWAHAVPGLYSPNATMQYACGSYSWLRHVIGTTEAEKAAALGISPYDVLNAEAEEAPAGAQGLYFLPHLMGERAPRWNPEAKGAYIGITSETTRADLVRSTLEGVAYNLGLCFDILNRKKDIESVTVIGGGAQGRVWCQIFSDMFGIPVQIPENISEANSLGAAVIAGVGAGLFPDFSAVKRFVKIRETLTPNDAAHARYMEGKVEFDRLYRVLFSQ